MKLAIAIPTRGVVPFAFAKCFRELDVGVTHKIVSVRGAAIDQARAILVGNAFAIGATHLLFLDEDVLFPPFAFENLYESMREHNLMIVSGIYAFKVTLQPGGFYDDPESEPISNRYRSITPNDLRYSERLFTHKHLSTGLGCTLIDMRVFEAVEEPWFRSTFWVRNGRKDIVTEDVYFFRKARAAGFKVYIDTSVKCDHVDWCEISWRGEMKLLRVTADEGAKYKPPAHRVAIDQGLVARTAFESPAIGKTDVRN
jgi:GT2 family glycosyltransferase